MIRAAWMIAACSLFLSPRAQAQQYPTTTSIMQNQPRLAQAPPAPPVLPAQQPPLPPLRPHPEPAPAVATSMSELAPTPEMWFYERAREEYEDPKNAVRANAEFRADQRRKRLASQQWFGYSNLRPSHTVTPTTQAASPSWGSNTRDPYIWSGAGRSTVVHFPGHPTWR